MDDADRWYFTKDQLANTPSRKCGISEAKELSFRQQAANFIQDMGQRLQVNQLCINTAIVYMHRFYVFHSFTEIHRNKLSLSALFLAAKVEEQPRKLEHLIKVAHACLHKDLPPLDVRSEAYQEKMFEVVAHENILLQTLGFVLAIEHPHTYVVKVCQLVKASKDLAQTSYIMATTSLHMTTMCLQYKPTVVACVCIHLACKWSDWRIEPCSEGRDWYFYVDRNVTMDRLEVLTDRFIAIMETSPHRFKKKFGQKDVNFHGPRSLMDEPSTSKAGTSTDNKYSDKDLSSPGPSGLSYDFADFDDKPLFRERSPTRPTFAPIAQPSSKPSSPVQLSSSQSQPTSTSHPKKPVKAETPHSISLDVYREKREKERLQNKASVPPPPPPPVESPSVHPHAIKKPQHAFHETERAPHRTSSKHVEMPSISNKERGKVAVVKEEPLDHSTSVNKVNHHITKVNSESGHHKERSSYSHKMPHPTSEPLIKLEKVDAVNKHVNAENIDTKPERVDLVRQERFETSKPDRVDPFKHERVDSVKHNRNDSIRHERVDSAIHEKVDPVRQEKMDPYRHERIEPVRHERIDSVKHETVDPVRYERIDPPLRHEKVNAIKHEKIDPIKQEFIDSELANTFQPELIKREKIDSIKKERVDYIKQERVDYIKQERVDITKHERVDTIKQERVDMSNQEKIHLRVEAKNSLPAVAPVVITRPSHKGDTGSEIKKEKREKHKKHSSHSSKEKLLANHSERAAPTGIKVKIPKTVINLSGIVPESSQKYPIATKPESPKRSLKIKLPKPPDNSKGAKLVPSTSIKLVITKDKSGTGSYSTRKRVHSNLIPDGNGKAVYDLPPTKYQKLEHSQKSHHQSKPSKSSRHSSHRSGTEHSLNDSGYGMSQHSANGNNACSTVNAQSYSQGFMYKFNPPPPLPKLKGYGMPTGKTNSNPPLPPPLPPPRSPPPPPPPPE